MSRLTKNVSQVTLMSLNEDIGGLVRLIGGGKGAQ